MASQPEILVEAKRCEQQPNTMQRFAMGIPVTFVGDLYEITVTCPHQSTSVYGMIGCHHPTHEPDCPLLSAEALLARIEEQSEEIRQQYLINAACACSDPHWMRNGPPVTLQADLAAAELELVGHGPKARYSAN